MGENKDLQFKPWIPSDLSQVDITNIPMDNEISNIARKMAEDINNKKTDVIKARLKELGIVINEDEEKHRRFKHLLCEVMGDEESYYYNDGSISGLKIVTFKMDMQPFDIDKCKIGYDIRYY